MVLRGPYAPTKKPERAQTTSETEEKENMMYAKKQVRTVIVLDQDLPKGTELILTEGGGVTIVKPRDQSVEKEKQQKIDAALDLFDPEAGIKGIDTIVGAQRKDEPQQFQKRRGKRGVKQISRTVTPRVAEILCYLENGEWAPQNALCDDLLSKIDFSNVGAVRALASELCISYHLIERRGPRGQNELRLTQRGKEILDRYLVEGGSFKFDGVKTVYERAY